MTDSKYLPDDMKVTRKNAERVLKWWNGGHPTTRLVPVSVTANGDVADTDYTPILPKKDELWKMLELCTHRLSPNHPYADHTVVSLGFDSKTGNEGYGLHYIDYVTSVDVDGDNLVITGIGLLGEDVSKWKNCSVSLPIVQKAIVKAKPAPTWYVNCMQMPVGQYDDWFESGMGQDPIIKKPVKWLDQFQGISGIKKKERIERPPSTSKGKGKGIVVAPSEPVVAKPIRRHRVFPLRPKKGGRLCTIDEFDGY